MHARSPYSLIILTAIIALLTICTPSCTENLYERVDVYIINCTEDNLRIENLTTSLHLIKDCVDHSDAVYPPNSGGAYLASLDANISTKTFTFTRSIWNYKHNLIITINAEALKKLHLGFDDPTPKVSITLREIEGSDSEEPSFTSHVEGDGFGVGFTAKIEHK